MFKVLRDVISKNRNLSVQNFRGITFVWFQFSKVLRQKNFVFSFLEITPLKVYLDTYIICHIFRLGADQIWHVVLRKHSLHNVI